MATLHEVTHVDSRHQSDCNTCPARQLGVELRCSCSGDRAFRGPRRASCDRSGTCRSTSCRCGHVACRQNIANRDARLAHDRPRSAPCGRLAGAPQRRRRPAPLVRRHRHALDAITSDAARGSRRRDRRRPPWWPGWSDDRARIVRSCLDGLPATRKRCRYGYGTGSSGRWAGWRRHRLNHARLATHLSVNACQVVFRMQHGSSARYRQPQWLRQPPGRRYRLYSGARDISAVRIGSFRYPRRCSPQ